MTSPDARRKPRLRAATPMFAPVRKVRHRHAGAGHDLACRILRVVVDDDQLDAIGDHVRTATPRSSPSRAARLKVRIAIVTVGAWAAALFAAARGP